jgi:hypothetical protein
MSTNSPQGNPNIPANASGGLANVPKMTDAEILDVIEGHEICTFLDLASSDKYHEITLQLLDTLKVAGTKQQMIALIGSCRKDGGSAQILLAKYKERASKDPEEYFDALMDKLCLNNAVSQLYKAIKKVENYRPADCYDSEEKIPIPPLSRFDTKDLPDLALSSIQLMLEQCEDLSDHIDFKMDYLLLKRYFEVRTNTEENIRNFDDTKLRKKVRLHVENIIRNEEQKRSDAEDRAREEEIKRLNTEREMLNAENKAKKEEQKRLDAESRIKEEEKKRLDAESRIKEEEKKRLEADDGLRSATLGKVDAQNKLEVEKNKREKAEKIAEDEKQIRLEIESQLAKERDLRVDAENKLREEQRNRASIENQLVKGSDLRAEAENEAKNEKEKRVDAELKMLDSENKAKDEEDKRTEAENRLVEEREGRMNAEIKAKEEERKRLEIDDKINHIERERLEIEARLNHMEREKLEARMKEEEERENERLKAEAEAAEEAAIITDPHGVLIPVLHYRTKKHLAVCSLIQLEREIAYYSNDIRNLIRLTSLDFDQQDALANLKEDAVNLDKYYEARLDAEPRNVEDKQGLREDFLSDAPQEERPTPVVPSDLPFRPSIMDDLLPDEDDTESIDTAIRDAFDIKDTPDKTPLVKRRRVPFTDYADLSLWSDPNYPIESCEQDCVIFQEMIDSTKENEPDNPEKIEKMEGDLVVMKSAIEEYKQEELQTIRDDMFGPSQSPDVSPLGKPKTEAKYPKESVTCVSCSKSYEITFPFCTCCGLENPTHKNLGKLIQDSREKAQSELDSKALENREEAEAAEKRGISVEQWQDLLHMAEAMGENRGWDQRKNGKTEKVYGEKIEWIDIMFQFESGKIKSEGGLDLGYSRVSGLTRLPKGLCVSGGLYLGNRKELTELPEDLEVEQLLDISHCTGLTSLPKSIKVDGVIHVTDDMHEDVKREAAERNKIYEAKENTKESEKRDITLEQWRDLLHIADAIGARKEWIDETFTFPCAGQIRTSGNLNLACISDLNRLPKGLCVIGDLSLNPPNNLTELPEDLEIKGDLHIEWCIKLTSLPKSLKVGGKIFVSDDMNERVKKEAQERNEAREKEAAAKEKQEEQTIELQTEDMEDIIDISDEDDIWNETPTETVPSIYEARTVKKGEYLEISIMTAGWPLTIENGAKVKIGMALKSAKIILLGEKAKCKIENDLGAEIEQH